MTETEQSLGVVYVVDDDEAVRDSLQWLLEGVNYSVQAYESAEAFLAAFDPQALACLILDVRMPGMSGLQLQEELAQRKAELPIVFITGHGDVPMAVSTMKKGAADFIEKPFDQAELKALVEKMLAQARESAAQRERARMNQALLGKLTAPGRTEGAGGEDAGAGARVGGATGTRAHEPGAAGQAHRTRAAGSRAHRRRPAEQADRR